MFKFSGFTSWRWMLWQKLHKTYRVTIITQNLYSLEKRCHSYQYPNFEQFRTLPKLHLDWLKWNPDDNLWQVSAVGRWEERLFEIHHHFELPNVSILITYYTYLFFRGHGNESCNLIGSIRGPYLWRNWSSRFTKSTRWTGYLAFRRWSGCSATLMSYCAAIKIISGAKLPIYQKFSMAERVTRHLRLLRQLKCLTASKTPTVLDYPRNFWKAAKDGLKRTTLWAVYYFTNPNSWYPALEQVTAQSIQKMRELA